MSVRRLLLARSETDLYVDSVVGDDANSGLARTAAKKTLDAAITLLQNSYGGQGRIWITAPSSSPLGSNITITSGDIALCGLDGADWYIERSYTWTSGWSSEGGGIYSRALGTNASRLFVSSQTDGDGFWLELTKNTSTPASPAAGEWGWDGAAVYVHLAGDANPNGETIKYPRSANLLVVDVGVNLVLRNGHFRVAQNNNCLTYAGQVTAYSCTFRYGSASGAGGSGIGTFYNCIAEKNGNDGWNITNGGITHLHNCQAAYNADEGASGHVTSQLYVYGGRYHHNQSAGIFSVGTTHQVLIGVLADYNGLGGGGAQDGAGIAFGTDNTGTCIDCTCQNNIGAGFHCNVVDGDVTVSGLTSGLAEGNGLADKACS